MNLCAEIIFREFKLGTTYIRFLIMRRIYHVFLCAFLIQALSAQELPPVQNYGLLDYAAGNQNWSITQNDDKHLFFGNNSGLLEFNGAVWKLYPSPNGTIIRAVYEKDGLIYSGCYMEFGFWKRNELGSLEYTSLLDKLSKPLIDDEHFWNITSREEWVLFQSLDRLYIYNTLNESFEIIEFVIPRAKIFNLKDKLYIQKGDGGLYSIQNGNVVLESNNPIFKENFIVGLYQHEGKLLVLSEKGRFYFLEDDRVTEWEIDRSSLNTDLLLYSSLKLRDGSFVLGTISGGYIRISKEGVLIEKMNQENGLANNTILAAFQDDDDNLWLGLDNGISVVNLESAFKVFIDSKGEIGAVYATLEHDGMLYLGTNQGLFARRLSGESGFKLVKGTSGQVWNLKKIDGTVFCAHTRGTFIITGESATPIYLESGTWEVKEVPGREDLLIQGNYSGLSILEKVDGQWVFKNDIEGFDISSKSFVFGDQYKIVVNHEFKGIHVLDLEKDYKSMKNLSVLGPVGFDSNIFRYQNKILYASNQGVFNFNHKTSTLVKDSLFTELFFNRDDAVLGRLSVEEENGTLWGFSPQNIIYVTQDSFDGEPEKEAISIPNFFRQNQGLTGYENISVSSQGNFVIGTANGYAVLDVNKFQEKDYTIQIDVVQEKFQNAENKNVSIEDSGEFNFDRNSLIVSYSIANYDKYTQVSYQYQLVGLHDDWSKWMSEPSISLENLPFGKYTINIRGRVGNQLTKNKASYSFKISKPWYLSNLAVILYVVTVLLIMLVINRLFVRYYKNQRNRLIEDNKKKMELSQLESKQEIMKLKNDRLRSELESKNRELATTAMSLINKNELLQGIKNDLLQLEDAASRKEVARVIDKNLSNNSDWEFFKEAFNNADKDFLIKMKNKHPELTANDLKFCAYLRLNLSSKEIAPLLNISVRSVEIKRYRLRKKMKLEHSVNLIDYILEI